MTTFLFLATGFEEIEALTVVDVLRRAGMDIKTVSITSDKLVKGAHGVVVEADQTFKEADFSEAEWLVLPGGMPGAENLHNFEALNELLKIHATKGKVAAICAAPAVVLGPLGVLSGREATCYPGFEDGIIAGGAIRRDAPVVALDKLITANGPSSALRFALAIVANSLGESYAHEVGAGMLYYPKSMNFYF
ncbi:MAG: DJ-1/PfpI family protein [Muribaculaceae bacterium]|nr:DJ-1/PfpI family protein [Muribaculaceae bacterium]